MKRTGGILLQGPRTRRVWIVVGLLIVSCSGLALAAGPDSDAVRSESADSLWDDASFDQKDMAPVPDVGAMLGRLVLAMLLILALLVGGVILFQKFGRRALKLGGGERTLRMVDRLALAPKKWACLVNVGGRYLLLGVGEKEITLLTEITLWQEPGEEKSFAGALENASKQG